MADRRGKAVFELERAEIAAVLVVAPRRRPALPGRRPPQPGASTFAAAPTGSSTSPTGRSRRDGSGEDGAFAEWLLAQPRLAIHDADARVAGRESPGRRPKSTLRQVEIAMRKEGRRHRVALNATPPAATRRAPRRARRPRLRAHGARRGGGRDDLRARPAGPTSRGCARTCRSPRRCAQRGGQLPRLGRVRAGARARGDRRHPTSRRARAARRRTRCPSTSRRSPAAPSTACRKAASPRARAASPSARATGLAAHGADFSLSMRPGAPAAARGEVRANGVDLKIAAALLDYLPVPREAKAQADRYAPRGRLLDSSLVWTGETPAKATRLAREGALRGPGRERGRGPSGRVRPHRLARRRRAQRQAAASTRATSPSRRASLFRAPLALDTLEARAHWKREARRDSRSASRTARLANADAEVTVAGTWRALPGLRGEVPGLGRPHGARRAGARAGRGHLPAERHRAKRATGWRRRCSPGDVSRRALRARRATSGISLSATGRRGASSSRRPSTAGACGTTRRGPSVDRVKGDDPLRQRAHGDRREGGVIYASRARGRARRDRRPRRRPAGAGDRRRHRHHRRATACASCARRRSSTGPAPSRAPSRSRGRRG